MFRGLLCDVYTTFQAQEFFFDVYSATETSQRAVRPDNSMAGDENGDRICGIGLSYRSRSVSISHLFGHPPIGAGFSIWNALECAPYFFPESRLILNIQRNIEGNRLPLEITFQLPFPIRHQFRYINSGCIGDPGSLLGIARKIGVFTPNIDPANALIGEYYGQISQDGTDNIVLAGVHGVFFKSQLFNVSRKL